MDTVVSSVFGWFKNPTPTIDVRPTFRMNLSHAVDAILNKDDQSPYRIHSEKIQAIRAEDMNIDRKLGEIQSILRGIVEDAYKKPDHPLMVFSPMSGAASPRQVTETDILVFPPENEMSRLLCHAAILVLIGNHSLQKILRQRQDDERFDILSSTDFDDATKTSLVRAIQHKYDSIRTTDLLEDTFFILSLYTALEKKSVRHEPQSELGILLLSLLILVL